MHLYHDSFPYHVMAFIWGPISGAGAVTEKKIETERNMDLENVLGNLLIAEYQVNRLRERLANMLSVYSRKGSVYQFKMGDAWFQVSVGAEKQVEMKPVVEEEKIKEDPNPNNSNIVIAGGQISGVYLSSFMSSGEFHLTTPSSFSGSIFRGEISGANIIEHDIDTSP